MGAAVRKWSNRGLGGRMVQTVLVLEGTVKKKEQLKAVRKQIKKLRRLKAVVCRIGDAKELGTGTLTLNLDSSTLTAYTHTLDELREVRGFLRKRLGRWEDKVKGVFGNMGNGVTAEFRSKHEPCVRIIFAAKPEDFPKELLPSEKCTIEVIEESHKVVTVSCPVGGSG